MSDIPLRLYPVGEATQSSRPSARETERQAGRSVQPERSDGTHGEAKRRQIVSTTAAVMMEPTGYGGKKDAPDMRHEGRGELQKKSPEIILGIF